MTDKYPELRNPVPTSTHWGNFLVEVRDGRISAVQAASDEQEPTVLGQTLLDAQDPNCRVSRPMVRKGYLEKRGKGDGAGRGREAFVAVPWDEALDLAAEAIERVRRDYGNASIYGGSYGWASAGRFHHAQSQLHRFLNCAGGYTASRDSYSTAAAETIMPHVLGLSMYTLIFQAPQTEDMREHTKLLVCFGGIAMKNTQVMFSGVGSHSAMKQLRRLREKDVQFINISPIRDDMADELNADWWPCRPGSDLAIMLGMAHTMVTEGLYDKQFVDSYCHGFEKFLPYLLGEEDAVPKDAAWAERLSAIPAEQIRGVARRLAGERTVIGLSWSLQRTEYGEQSYWMATVLAAMAGHIGLPGGGVVYGFGSVHNSGFAGRYLPNYRMAALPQGENPVADFIPVARIADMLLNPGGRFDYNGRTLTYPDIQLVYWAGGNPFHHHQDINRLRKAWSKPGTVIVNEPFWTATARHADIVFPGNTSLERNDIGGSSFDCHLGPMPQAVASFAESRSDYAILSALAERLGFADSFTEGRDEWQWIEKLYEETCASAREAGVELPDFETFWMGEAFSIADQLPPQKFELEKFREDPEAYALNTPSGKIECYSETIESFDYDDCRGHPRWYEKQEWLGADRAKRFPLHLVSNQPKLKLHSQYDHSRLSRSGKNNDRARVRMHPEDAGDRSLRNGDVVRIFNDRGSCLACVVSSDQIRRNVIELETGTWYDPLDPQDPLSLDVHGNPNVLTRDAGSSRLAQGPTAHSCLVELEKFNGEVPPVRVFTLPEIEEGA